jgi:hypothetical protein
MAVINFTTGDILRNKLLEKGWYHFKVSVTGPTPNKAKDGVNYTAVLTLIDAGEMDGKEIQRVFSNKAISMMLPLIAAVKGTTVDQMEKAGFSFNTEELADKKIDGMVDQDVWEGQLRNVCEIYAPYKSQSNVTPF